MKNPAGEPAGDGTDAPNRKGTRAVYPDCG